MHVLFKSRFRAVPMVHLKRFLCVFIKLSHKYFAEVAEQLKKKERRKYGNDFFMSEPRPPSHRDTWKPQETR
jgi:hypothetical protein